MPYLSRFLNTKIYDSADEYVGKLVDVLVKPSSGEYSSLEYLAVKHKKHKRLIFVPYETVENFSSQEVSLRTLFSKLKFLNSSPDEYIYLNRDVMDQQIVDISGARVVRANDLRVGDVEGKMSVLAIDVSFRALLRRLGVVWLDIFEVFKVNLIDWRKIQTIKGELKLDSVSKDLSRLHPADIANIVEDLSLKQGRNLVLSLDKKIAARVFEEIDPEIQKILISSLSPEHAARISERMSIDELVDLIQTLPEDESKELMEFVEQDRVKKVKKLLTYDEDTAGGLMTTEYLSCLPEETVGDAIEKIRKLSDNFSSINYLYIVDENGKYKGVMSFRRILVAKLDTPLKNVMKRSDHMPVLHPHQSIKHVAQLMTKYNLNSVAVIDKERKILGVVTVDDVMRVLVPNA